jgi:NAD(P)-dependent dehydrogenase (short-subunit alcohol dehydrogenase family)
MERQQELDLTDKVAIVTGASRGIGRQTAIDLARRGAKVVIAARTVDRDSAVPGSLSATAKQIEDAGGEALMVQADLTNHEDLRRLVAETVAHFGGIDILVNNAASTVGSVWSKAFLDITFDEWSYHFDIHVHAPFILMQLVTPIMASRGGGRIINITTGSAEAHRLVEEVVPPAGSFGQSFTVPSYFASKRALDRLGNVVAPELRDFNVFVMTMHPGFVASEVVTARLESQDKEGKATPIETGVPARMIVYFAACANPEEYTGRLFKAEREFAELGLDRSDLGASALATAG